MARFLLDVGLDGVGVLVDLSDQRHGEALASLAEQGHAPEGGMGEVADVPSADAPVAGAAFLAGQLGGEVIGGDLEDAASDAVGVGPSVDGFGDASQDHDVSGYPTDRLRR